MARLRAYRDESRIVCKLVHQKQRIDYLAAKSLPSLIGCGRALTMDAKTSQCLRHGDESRLTGDSRPVFKVAELYKFGIEPAKTPRHVSVEQDRCRLANKIHS